MAKYSKEFKMKVVKKYLESRISYKFLTDMYGMPNTCVVKRSVNAYKSQVYEGVKVKEKIFILQRRGRENIRQQNKKKF